MSEKQTKMPDVIIRSQNDFSMAREKLISQINGKVTQINECISVADAAIALISEYAESVFKSGDAPRQFMQVVNFSQSLTQVSKIMLIKNNHITQQSDKKELPGAPLVCRVIIMPFSQWVFSVTTLAIFLTE